MALCRGQALEDPGTLGELGEWLAHGFLLRHGYDLVARNWETGFGEVDRVALRDGCVHFVEVKTRRMGTPWPPEEAVTPEKEERYRSLAACFLRRNGLEGWPVRFDVVAVEVGRRGTYTLELLEEAF